MQIPPPAQTVILSGSNPQTSGWRAGQILDALVVRSERGSTRAEIRVGQLQLAVQLPTRVPEGTRLLLQVVQAGARPVLNLVSPAATAATQVPVPHSPAPSPSVATAPAQPGILSANWLTSLLPVQGSQAHLLAALSWLDAQPQRLQTLPQPVRAEVLKVAQQLTPMDQATNAQGLRQAVRDSGLFHESTLAVQAVASSGSASVPAANLKSALLSLAARLRAFPVSAQPPPNVRNANIPPPPSPGQSPTPQPRMEAHLVHLGREALLETLRTRTDAALARMVLHQWSAVESAESGLPRWLLELPLRNQQGVDLIHLLLEKEPRQHESSDEPTWRAELALDLPGLGPLHVHVAITGSQVQTRFWAESEETVRRVRAALPKLKDGFENRDLTVRDLGCNPGRPPARGPTAQRGPLLDDHA
ncbi:flagellar hook-length control protein FliK [Thioalkalivibrio denitrificans]|uniref:Flagellar hook-length control protein FliK n=1 Tax=Thioalkalivibrio denitrificans TaxID=108003 RepID=A0A1V3NHD3_9GAMM|nr:flagellar hook-length control protein FliK [Thioalkalivibrio denitrificans]OOG24517.1 flagellar hook-length control protein FliK [Thioalkalivibrio denitrificans]